MIPIELETAADLEYAFQEWNELLYQYAFVRLRDRELAEDIIQETFMKAWQRRDTFDSQKSSLKNWLFVIATNLLRDHFRSAKKKSILELDEEIAKDEDLAKTIEEKDLVQFVFQKMRYLSDRDQEILVLRYTQGFSVKEIAEMINIEYSAAKVAIHRAIKKLQELCNETGNRSYGSRS